MRQRFELQFCDLSGVPGSFEAIRVVIDHRDGRRRYAATEPIQLSFGTATVPSLAFSCRVYPSKTVQLRLMAAVNEEGRPRTPGLLRRSSSLKWQQLATAPLPLGQLAPSTAMQDASPAADALSSTRGSSMDQSTLTTSSTGVSSSLLDLPSSTAPIPTHSSTVAGLAGTDSTTSPFQTMSAGGGDADEAGSDSGQLFSSDSLAAAAAQLTAQQQQAASPSLGSSSGSGGLRTPGRARRSSGEEAAPSHVSGVWVAGDSQVTRMTLQWIKDSTTGGRESTVMDQEVVVIAKVMEQRPSFSNLFGLRLSPSKTSLQPHPSPRSLEGGTTPRAGSLTPQGGSLTPQGGSLTPRGTSTTRLFDAAGPEPAGAAATASGTQPSPLHSDTTRQQQGPQDTDMKARRVTFDPAAKAPITLTSQKHGAAGGTSVGGQATPAADHQAATQAEAEADEAAQKAARRDFLELILSTLSSAPSIDSEAGSSLLNNASPAQLAAAASLPRAPSTKDLAVFAAAAGLPFEAVTQAAVSTRLSVTGAGTPSSRGSSVKGRQARSNGSGSGNSNGHGSPRQHTAGTAADSPSGAAKPSTGSGAAGTAGEPAAVDAAAAAAVAAASAAAQAAGLPPPALSAAATRGSTQGRCDLSPASVSVATTAAPAAPAADITGQSSSAGVTAGPQAAAAAAAGTDSLKVSGAPRQTKPSKLVSSTAMITSAPEGDASSGWEPQHLAVATITAAVPQPQPQPQMQPGDAVGPVATESVPNSHPAHTDEAAAGPAAAPVSSSVQTRQAVNADLTQAPASPAGALPKPADTTALATQPPALLNSSSGSSSSSRETTRSTQGVTVSGMPPVSTRAQEAAGPGLGASELSGPGSPLQGLSERYNRLIRHQQQQQQQQQHQPSPSASPAPDFNTHQQSDIFGPSSADLPVARANTSARRSPISAGSRHTGAVNTLEGGQQAAASGPAGPPAAAVPGSSLLEDSSSTGPSVGSASGGSAPGVSDSRPSASAAASALLPAAPTGPEHQELPTPGQQVPLSGSEATRAPLRTTAVDSEIQPAAEYYPPVPPVHPELGATLFNIVATAAPVSILESNPDHSAAAAATQSSSSPTAAAAVTVPLLAAAATAAPNLPQGPVTTAGSPESFVSILHNPGGNDTAATPPAAAAAAAGQGGQPGNPGPRQHEGSSSSRGVPVLHGAGQQQAPHRLAAVLATRQPSLTRTGLSTAPSCAAPSTSGSTTAAAVAPAAATVLAAAGTAAAAGGAMLPAAAAAAATAGVTVTVFALRQAAGLFQLAGRAATAAALAAPRAAYWAAQQTWPYIANTVTTATTTTTTTGSSSSSTDTRGSGSSASWLLPQWWTSNKQVAPVAADLAAAGASAGPTPSTTGHTLPPSLGGTASSRWAPSAGSPAAASLTAVVLSPLAVLWQWPYRTVTTLLEASFWALVFTVITPFTAWLGLLRYIGLLPRESPGRPAASSVEAAGGLAAQGPQGPGTAHLAAAGAAGAGAAEAEGPAGDICTGRFTRGRHGSLGVDTEGRELTAAAAAGAAAAGLGPGAVGSVLSVPVVPEEDEVVADELVSSPVRSGSTYRYSFNHTPPTPAPSMEAPGSSAQRTWSLSFLSSALSRLGSTTLTTPPTSSTAPSIGNDTITTRSSSGSSGTTAVPVDASTLTASSSLSAAAPAGTNQVPAISSSRSSSRSSSISRSASSSRASSGTLGRSGSWWLGGKRGSLLQPALAATDVDTMSAQDQDRLTPAAMLARVSKRTATAGAAEVPSTPPPTPLSSGSFSQTPTVHRAYSDSTLTTAGTSATTTGAMPEAAYPMNVLQVLTSAAAGVGHVFAAVACSSQAVLLAALQPGMWLFGSMLHLLQSGVATAAWLVSWLLWWAALPLKLAWWAMMLPVRMGLGVWRGMLWLAGGVWGSKGGSPEPASPGTHEL